MVFGFSTRPGRGFKIGERPPRSWPDVGDVFEFEGAFVEIGREKSIIRKNSRVKIIPTEYLTKREFKPKVKQIIRNL